MTDDGMTIKQLDAVCKTWNTHIKVVQVDGQPQAVIK